MLTQAPGKSRSRGVGQFDETTFEAEDEDSVATIEMLIERLGRIEDKLQMLLQQKIVQKFYSTGDVAKVLNKAEFTVREWCRLRRIRAEKRPCGRGHSLEWMISHEELDRIKAEGLLRPEDQLQR